MNKNLENEILIAFANELLSKGQFSEIQIMDFLTDLTNAIYVATTKVGA